MDVSPRAIAVSDRLAALTANRDRLKSQGPIALPGAYIERYIARRKRKKTAPKEYVYYRLRNPSGIKHQSLGKLGSPKYQAAADAIARRNQISAMTKEINTLSEKLKNSFMNP